MGRRGASRRLGLVILLVSGVVGAAASTAGASPRVVRPMSMVPSLGYDPATDLGSLSQVTQFVGAQVAPGPVHGPGSVRVDPPGGAEASITPSAWRCTATT